MASVNEFRFEPSVASAWRRYWWLVVAAAIVGTAAGYGFSRTETKVWTAQASLAIPPSPAQQVFGSSAAVNATEYLSQQVAELQSPALAAQAARIVEARSPRLHLTGPLLAAGLVVTPPVTGGNNSAVSAAGTATIAFTARPAKLAAQGANAMVAAYERSRTVQLQAETKAALAGIDSSLAAVDGQLTSLSGQIATLQARQAVAQAAEQAREQALADQGIKVVPAPPPQDAQLQALVAQQSNLDKRQSDLLSRRDQIQTNEQQALAEPIGSVPAVAPTSPSTPKTLRNVALGGLVMAVAGLIASYVIALRRRRFGGRHDPEGLLEAPLLGDVPVFQAERITAALPYLSHPTSTAAEAFRFVASSLRAVRSGEGSFSMAVTSARVGAGKTTMAANIALALADGGGRVLAVDADFVRWGLTTQLLGRGESDGNGLAEVLLGRSQLSDAAIPVEGVGGGQLWLLTPGVLGTRLPNLVTNRADAFFQETKDSYDFIVVDSLPLLQAAYARSVLDSVTYSVAVVNHQDMVRPLIEFVRLLGQSRSRVLGYIYNRAPSREDMGAYYRYYRADGDQGARRSSTPTLTSSVNGTGTRAQAELLGPAVAEPSAPGLPGELS